jgi:hypothetical protein
MKTIKIEGAPNANPKICGKRPSVGQNVYNAMIPRRLKPKHKGPHAWRKIGKPTS